MLAPVGDPTTMTYEVTGRVARITLNRPERANAITLDTPRELAHCVERADADADVHAIVLAGRGTGFCGGYDLAAYAEQAIPNHDPAVPWDPAEDLVMMRRNVDGFMSLMRAAKPVVCKVHGYCVAGGTDIALCSDLLVIAADAKIGYPPARVWGSPTTALWAHRIGVQRAARLLFTGDSLSGEEAAAWGLAIEAPAPAALDARVEALLERIVRVPVSQLVMMKLLLTQTLMAQGVPASQTLGTLLDGAARHSPEGYAFQRRAAEAGFRQAVRERDEPFGDAGRSTHKG
jgi:enoyl-CoA hydratase